MNKITILGISILFLYCSYQILKFYGVDLDSFKIYMYFYILIIISMFILPTDYPKI
jgi:hypothetical protein